MSVCSRHSEQGTKNRTQQQLELEIENMGAHLNAYTSVRRPNHSPLFLPKLQLRTLP